MTKLAKKASQIATKLDPLNALGVSKSSFLRQTTGSTQIENLADGGPLTLRSTVDPGDWANHDSVVDARKDLENQKVKRVMPLADEAGLAAARRRARASNRGRASTILGSDSEALG